MKWHVVDLKGNKAGEIDLNDNVFAVDPNFEIMTQAIRVHLFNKRQGTHKTKTRGEVSGSGAKPWSQKGTGRARVGEKRNPVWVHGGISHGPLPKNWNLGFNKQDKKIALISALTDKVKSGSFIVVENLKDLKGKTKEAVEIVKKLEAGTKPLFISSELNAEIRRSLRNIKGLSLSNSALLTAFQVIKANKVVATKDAIANLEKRLGK